MNPEARICNPSRDGSLGSNPWMEGMSSCLTWPGLSVMFAARAPCFVSILLASSPLTVFFVFLLSPLPKSFCWVRLFSQTLSIGNIKVLGPLLCPAVLAFCHPNKYQLGIISFQSVGDFSPWSATSAISVARWHTVVGVCGGKSPPRVCPQ